MSDATPSQDRGHEALRRDILAAVADTGDSFYLFDVLFDLLDSLTARVAALEPPTP